MSKLYQITCKGCTNDKKQAQFEIVFIKYTRLLGKTNLAWVKFNNKLT